MYACGLFTNMNKISLLIPAHNEEASIPMLYSGIRSIIDSLDGYEWEIMFVDDGSTDHTAATVLELRKSDPRVNLLSLSRNFGKEAAMLAGMDYISGDATLIMDADGQHPVTKLPEMLELWEQGYDDIYAVRKKRDTDSYIRRQFSQVYYKLLKSAMDSSVIPNAGDFRLLDRRCIDTLKNLRESKRYTKGLYSWMGFKKHQIEYVPSRRHAGKSNYSIGKLFALAIDGITSSSTKPLRLASILGCVIALTSFVYMAYMILKTILYGDPVTGFPTLISVILFLGGTQLLSIGIMGEYIGSIFVESKRRPPYVADRLNDKKIRL